MAQNYDSPQLNTLLGGSGVAPAAPTSTANYDSAALNKLLGGSIAPTAPVDTASMFSKSQAAGLGTSDPAISLSKEIVGSFPFSDSAKQTLSGMNYQSKDYSKTGQIVSSGKLPGATIQGGEYDTGTKNISVDLQNNKIPADQQKIVMQHEMLNSLYPQSLAGKNPAGFNSDWEKLKASGSPETKQALADIDNHMKNLGYQNLGTNALSSSRFSYLAQESPSDVPPSLQKYYDGILNFSNGTASQKAPVNAAGVKDLESTLQGQSEMLNALGTHIDTVKKTLNLSDQKAVDNYNAMVDHYQNLSNAYKANNDVYNSHDVLKIRATPDLAGTTVKSQLPNAIEESLPFGIGAMFQALHSQENEAVTTGNPDLLKITGKDLAQAAPGAALDTGKGFVKSPISGALDIAGTFSGKKINFNVPGLGQVSNAQFNAAKRVAAGEDPLTVSLSEGSGAIFDTLFFASLVSKPFTAQLQTTAKSGLSADNFKGNIEAIQPKSFREYKPVTSARVLSPDFIEKAKAQGADFGKNFDPSRPTIFRMTYQPKGNMFVGEVQQIKPSMFDQIVNKFGGNMNSIPPEALQIVGKPVEVKSTDLQKAFAATKGESTETPIIPAPHAEANIAPIEKVSSIHPTILEEAQAHVQNEGEGATHVALQDALGHTPEQATAVVNEAVKQNAIENPVPLQSKIENTETQIKNFDTDKAIKEGSIIVEKVYSNPEAKILTPEFAKGRVADVAQKLDAFKPGLSTEFKKSIDIKNTTYKQIVDNGIKVLNGKEISKPTSVKKENSTPKYSKNNQGKIISENGLTVSNGLEKHSFNSPAIKNFAEKIQERIPNADYINKANPDELAKIRDNMQELRNEFRKSEIPELFDKNQIGNKKQIQAGKKIEELAINRLKKQIDNGISRAEDHASAILWNQYNIPEGGYPKNKYPEGQVNGRGSGGGKVVTPIEEPINDEAGFIDPVAIAEDIKKFKDKKTQDWVDKTLKPIELSDRVGDNFIKLEGENQADLETGFKVINDVKITPQENQNVYRYGEDPSLPVTDTERKTFENLIEPILKIDEELTAHIKAKGIPDDPVDSLFDSIFGKEEQDPRGLRYMPRTPKDKPSALQKIFSPLEGKTPTIKQGGVLSKSTASLKSRVYKALVDPADLENVRIVAEKDGEMTALSNKGKMSKPMGSTKQKITPRTKEFFDKAVTPVLEKVAADLGIRHEVKPLPGNKAGLSYTGKNLVQTHPGAPERVLIHEIGHQIDEKYGLQEFFASDPATNFGHDVMQEQQRAVADLAAGEGASKSFKNYTRKGAEKIAQLFEAYLHVPEQFKEVAPDLFGKFEAFLQFHPELRPIRSIEPSLEMGMNKHGGEHVGGTKGNAFVDKSGKKWIIGHATTDEITNATGQEYYQDAVSSVLLRHIKLSQIARAVDFTEQWKNSPEFKEIARPVTEIPPAGWKPTQNFSFRNYWFEPRTAEVLDDMQNKMRDGNYNDAFRGINRLFADMIFFNGFTHPINVATTYMYNRGASGLLPKNIAMSYRNLGKALKALNTKNDDYMELLRNGAHLMSSDLTNKKVAETLNRKFNQDLENLPPTMHGKVTNLLAKLAGQLTFKKNIIYKFSHDMAWLSNDLFTMASIYDAMDKNGMTMAQAVKETARFIPDYRLKSRLLDKPLSAIGYGNTSRNLAQAMYNSNFTMFGSYHIGLLESLANTVGDTINAGEGFNAEANATRAKGSDKLLGLAMMGLLFYGAIKMAQKKTGNDNTYISAPGILKYPYLAYKAMTGEADASQVITNVVPFAIGSQAIAEEALNRDVFTGNKIYGIGREGQRKYLGTKIAPMQFFTAMHGTVSAGGVAAALLNVHTPASTKSGSDLAAAIFDEKPQVDSQVKTLVSAGDTAGALKAVISFNDELKALIKKADTDNGGSGSDARVQFFLKQYGLKMPGAQAMANYETRKNRIGIGKILPGAVETHASPYGSPDANSILAGNDDDGTIKGYNPDDEPIFARDVKLEAQRRVELYNKDPYWQANGYALSDLQFDHIIPLEAGGTNTGDNVMLITKKTDQENQAMEDYLGRLYSSGKISRADAATASMDYKINKSVTLTDIEKGKY